MKKYLLSIVFALFSISGFSQISPAKFEQLKLKVQSNKNYQAYKKTMKEVQDLIKSENFSFNNFDAEKIKEQVKNAKTNQDVQKVLTNISAKNGEHLVKLQSDATKYLLLFSQDIPEIKKLSPKEFTALFEGN